MTKQLLDMSLIIHWNYSFLGFQSNYEGSFYISWGESNITSINWGDFD